MYFQHKMQIALLVIMNIQLSEPWIPSWVSHQPTFGAPQVTLSKDFRIFYASFSR